MTEKVKLLKATYLVASLAYFTLYK